MTNEEILLDLTKKNLRLATKNEAGWYVEYSSAGGSGNRSIWVTSTNEHVLSNAIAMGNLEDVKTLLKLGFKDYSDASLSTAIENSFQDIIEALVLDRWPPLDAEVQVENPPQ